MDRDQLLASVGQALAGAAKKLADAQLPLLLYFHTDPAEAAMIEAIECEIDKANAAILAAVAAMKGEA